MRAIIWISAFLLVTSCTNSDTDQNPINPGKSDHEEPLLHGRWILIQPTEVPAYDSLVMLGGVLQSKELGYHISRCGRFVPSQDTVRIWFTADRWSEWRFYGVYSENDTKLKGFVRAPYTNGVQTFDVEWNLLDEEPVEGNYDSFVKHPQPETRPVCSGKWELRIEPSIEIETYLIDGQVNWANCESTCGRKAATIRDLDSTFIQFRLPIGPSKWKILSEYVGHYTAEWDSLVGRYIKYDDYPELKSYPAVWVRTE